MKWRNETNSCVKINNCRYANNFAFIVRSKNLNQRAVTNNYIPIKNKKYPKSSEKINENFQSFLQEYFS